MGSRLASDTGEAVGQTQGDGDDSPLMSGGSGGRGETASVCLGGSPEPEHLSPTGPWDRIKPAPVTEIMREQDEQIPVGAIFLIFFIINIIIIIINIIIIIILFFCFLFFYYYFLYFLLLLFYYKQ